MKRKLKRKSESMKKKSFIDRPLDFALIGRAIRRKLIRKGMSLLGWSTGPCQTAQSSHVDWDQSDGNCMHDTENSAPGPSETRPRPEETSTEQPTSDDLSEHNATVTDETDFLHHEVDVNINAIDHGRSHSGRSSAHKKSKKKKRIKKSGVLVARSYGKPKQASAKQIAVKPPSDRTSKRSKNLKILKKIFDKLQDDFHRISRSLDEELKDSISTISQKTAGIRASAESETDQKENVADCSLDLRTGHKAGRAQKRQKQRTHRKTADLINIYQAGPSHQGQELQNKRCQRLRDKRVRNVEGPGVKTRAKSSLSSPRLPIRHGSNDSVDWPSLPGRPKGQAKESAKEIIKNKQSGSNTKTTRRRWADVLAGSSEDNVSGEANGRHKDSTRTWASVASNGLTKSCDKTREATPSSPNLSYPNKRKKNNSEDGNGQDDQEVEDIINKASCSVETRRQANKEDGQGTSQEGRVDEDPCEQISNSGSFKANNSHENGCCIDNMSFVYTKPVGAVISLNEGKTKRKKGVNKCNNRTATPFLAKDYIKYLPGPSKTVFEKENSDLELCDRLSLMSFNSLSASSENSFYQLLKAKHRENAALQQKASKSRRPGTSSVYKEGQKSNQEDGDRGKQKKVSLKYRALMRGESGRLDAKTLADVSARTRRNENLQVDKEAHRNLQRKQRQMRQQTSHNVQRSPTETQKSKNTSSVSADEMETPAKKSPTNKDKPSINKDKPSMSKCKPPTTKDKIPTFNEKPSTSKEKNFTCKDKPSTSKDKPSTSKEKPSTNTEKPSTIKVKPSASNQNEDEVNKSDNRYCANIEDVHKQNVFTAFNSPVYAQSAPDLNRQSNKICLELQPANSDMLDIGWWHAYLLQKPVTSENTVAASTRNKCRNKS
ncbi:hypothetical protein Btru_060408 [Bulinus truncatus]|nr:hypothetical protein Btru_060408 [Bulinus truncatus]